MVHRTVFRVAVIICVGVGALGLAAEPARCSVCGTEHDHGERQEFPYVSGHADLRLHADTIYDAEVEGNEIEWLKTHSHLDLEVHVLPWVRFAGSVKVEEMHRHGGHSDADHDHGEGHDDEESHEHGEHAHDYDGEDRVFADHVAVIEELRVVLSPGPFELFAGKFNPLTGLNMHLFPGYYGYEMPEEYSILERLGGGGSYTFDTDGFGTFRLEASAFCADTTFLNEGVGEDRLVPHDRSDGGLANTERLESYAIALEGYGWYTNIGDTFHEFSWLIGAAHQDAGSGEDDTHAGDEERFSVGAVYRALLTRDLGAQVIGEILTVDGFGGDPDGDITFSSAGAELTWRRWSIGGTYTDISRDHGSDGHHAQLSAGYVFPFGLGLHVGIKDVDNDGDHRNSVGVMVSYHGSF